MTDQLSRGQSRRLMYVEKKMGSIDGAKARIGWVTFSKTRRTIYYRGLTLETLKGSGIRGNYFDVKTGDEYWVSGVKKRGSNAHRAEAKVVPRIDEDAVEEYEKVRAV